MINEMTFQREEGRLPAGQVPIQTAILKEFCTLVYLLKESKRKTGYSTMGLVTGRAGVGKTIAIQAFMQSQVAQVHTGLPACVAMSVKPQSTPKALVEDLLARLGERVIRLHHNRYKLADEAARAILSNDVQLIFVDEADQLNEEGFELLRYIFDKTGCPIVIVGLRTIQLTLDRHEKFTSRIGLRLDFRSPSDEEILTTVLPQLVFPYWSFDPTSGEDRMLGKQIWERAKPSFRDLRVVLEYASQVAEMRGEAHITPAILKMVYQLMKSPRKTDISESPIISPETTTAYEQESRQRQDAKKKRREKGKKREE